MLNEIASLGRPSQFVEKPLELRKLEQMEELGLPIWAGGIQDQPHIWLNQIGIIRNVRKAFTQPSDPSE